MASIFFFWFFLAKDNYFHWDEWILFSNERVPLTKLLFTHYLEHYIPLHFLYYYSMYKLFGLNYLPYQLVISLFQTINSWILFKVVYRITNKFKLSVVAMLLFGLSSIGVENLIWSIGDNHLFPGFLTFAAFLLFLKYLESKSTPHLLTSAFLLFVAPLFNDYYLLHPLAFVASLCLLRLFRYLKDSSWIKSAAIYLVVQLLNIAVLLLFSGSNATSKIHPNISFAIDVLRFVVKGISEGLVIKFIMPSLYFFPHSSSILGRLVRPGLLALGLAVALFILARLLPKLKEQPRIIKAILITLPFIPIGYLAAAMGRIDPGFGQAAISRYGYQPLFYLLILVMVVVASLKGRPTILYFLFLILATMHIISSVNFNNLYWQPIISRDKQFVQEFQDLTQRNKYILNYSTLGIMPSLHLSDYWYLDSGKNIYINDLSLKDNFIPDQKTQAFYDKLTIGEWSHKAD